MTLTPDPSMQQWLRFAYAGDVVGGTGRPQPDSAERLFADLPRAAFSDDPWLACAIGDLEVLQRAYRDDPLWLAQAGGPLALPPLVAVTHSALLRCAGFRERLHACARWLLSVGVDPNQSIGSRWPPATVAAPDASHPLSALYGAAGQHHDVALTRMLLQAGADPNDGESLYHALDDVACTKALLEAGANPVGCNAIYRVLDLDATEVLRLLLQHGADANEGPPSASAGEWGRPILWAIRRRRSVEQVSLLIAAGADLAYRTAAGVNAATMARRYGLSDIADLLESHGVRADSSAQERFVAACAVGDEAAAQALRPALTAVACVTSSPAQPSASVAVPASVTLASLLTDAQLRLLPELAAQGCLAAVHCMVRQGWPIDVTGGDWGASALNQAVFRGDADVARVLIAHGASWRERHGYGDDCSGTLSWASFNAPDGTGDWLGCAQALVDGGMPGAVPNPDDPYGVLLDGRPQQYSALVTEYLLSVGAQARA